MNLYLGLNLAAWLTIIVVSGFGILLFALHLWAKKLEAKEKAEANAAGAGTAAAAT